MLNCQCPQNDDTVSNKQKNTSMNTNGSEYIVDPIGTDCESLEDLFGREWPQWKSHAARLPVCAQHVVMRGKHACACVDGGKDH